MAKAFDDEINQQLRALAKQWVKERGGGTDARLAEYLDVSPGFVSDFLNEKRGAGLETLIGLGRFAPLQLLRIVGIEPGVIVTLLEGQSDEGEATLSNMPNALKRAARAAIELTGCSPGEAGAAALAVFAAFQDRPDDDPDWWLIQIRKIIDGRPKSGIRPSEKPLS